MAAPQVIQFDSEIQASGSSCQVTLPGVTAGNTLVVIIGDYGANTRTFNLSSDDKANTYATAAGGISDVRGSRIDYAEDVAAGDTVVTVTTSGTDTYIVIVAEIEPSTLDVGDDHIESVATSTHNCAPAGAIDTTDNVIVFMVGVMLGSSASSVTGNGSYTELVNNGLQYVAAYRRSDTALSDERAAWTTGNPKISSNSIASFVAAGDEESESSSSSPSSNSSSSSSSPSSASSASSASSESSSSSTSSDSSSSSSGVGVTLRLLACLGAGK